MQGRIGKRLGDMGSLLKYNNNCYYYYYYYYKRVSFKHIFSFHVPFQRIRKQVVLGSCVQM